MTADGQAVCRCALQGACCQQRAVSSVLSTECCQQRAVNGVLSTACCQRRAVSSVLSAVCCQQRAVNSVLSAACCQQRAVSSHALQTPQHKHTLRQLPMSTSAMFWGTEVEGLAVN